MTDPLVVIGLTLLGVVAVKFLAILLVSKGNLGNLGLATRVSLRTLGDPEFAGKVKVLLEPPPPPPPPKPDGAPLRLLNLLQREGRLLDFLLENIEPYPNDLIGANVRDLHRKCQKAVTDHLSLEPVLNAEEETTVQVPAGFDPSAILLTGNVTGQPPFRGTLKHRGWRVKEIKLVKPAEGVDEFVVQPAEVEMG